MSSHILSKSSFIKGLQCHKYLYLNKHNYKQQDPLSEEQQIKFRNGHDFWIAGSGAIPGWLSNAKPKNAFGYDKSVKDTAQFIRQGYKTIYEAAFSYNGVMAALDILVNDDDKWTAYEVKNSYELSDTYLSDAALQYYIISNSGLKLDNFCMIYRKEIFENIDNFDINEIFIIESVLETVIERQNFITYKVEELKTAINDPQSLNIKMGEQCYYPYNCSFIGYCSKQAK